MQKYFKLSILLLLYFSLVSCTTLGILSEEEKKVKIAFSKNLVKDCHFIDGFITGALMNPNAAFKEKALEMGGDTILVHKKVVKHSLGLEVYRCSEQLPKTEENVQAEDNQVSPE